MEFRFRNNGVLALLGAMAFYYSLAYIQSMVTRLYLYGHPDESLPGSTHFNGSHYRVAGWNAEGGFYTIQIFQPKIDCVYSVTIMSPNKYTGIAQLQSRDHLVVVYTWRPIFPLEDYEVIVHELAPGYAQKQFQKPTFPLHPGGITISVQEQQLGDRASLFQNEWNEAPLCITNYDKTDALSTWDGTWVGPDLQLDLDWNTGDKNWLRTGWRFLPSPEMNCRIEAFSTEDLLSIPPGLDGKEKSIMVIGTSVMRGVFLSMADLLLPFGEKRYFAPSVIGKCWGRAHVKKGNLRLMYQDFRVGEFEKPGENGADLVECHNDMIAKEGSDFLCNAYRVWDEVFEDANKWPDTIFLLSGYGWGYDNSNLRVTLFTSPAISLKPGDALSLLPMENSVVR